MSKNRRINGERGTFIIDGTSANTDLNYEVIIPTEDTVLSVCTGLDNDGDSFDFKAEMNWDGTLTTAHGSLTVPRGFKITAITLTSGEIVCL